MLNMCDPLQDQMLLLNQLGVAYYSLLLMWPSSVYILRIYSDFTC